MERLSV
ncbi:hypothetical protein BIW11_09365 [Tropilaelaps mercedesae]|nr:hypothetical protein BIW11_09365 [Tropilaelaps mercedesae]